MDKNATYGRYATCSISINVQIKVPINHLTSLLIWTFQNCCSFYNIPLM